MYRDALVDVPFQANRQTAKGTNTQDTAGFYVQDMIELAPQWKALLGVRYDVFDQEYADDLTHSELSRTDTTLDAAPQRQPVFGALADANLACGHGGQLCR